MKQSVNVRNDARYVKGRFLDEQAAEALLTYSAQGVLPKSESLLSRMEETD